LFVTLFSSLLLLRELDLRNNDLGVKEAKLLETVVQRCYGLVKLYIFTDEELKKKELISTMQNIDWYVTRVFPSFFFSSLHKGICNPISPFWSSLQSGKLRCDYAVAPFTTAPGGNHMQKLRY
jgi:hypothetical protein